VCLRIQLSRATVKDLHSRLQHAYKRDNVRLVRRITVLIDLLVHHGPVAVLGERWGLSTSCLYQWRQAFLLYGMDSLAYNHSGGRRPPLVKVDWSEFATSISGGFTPINLDRDERKHYRAFLAPPRYENRPDTVGQSSSAKICVSNMPSLEAK
jgi:hypothetical protein